MSTNVSCEYFNNHLMAFLEHEVDDTARASMERHAVSCAECGALLADLRKLRVDAANLPELTPSRDLWSGIAERIETPIVPISSGNLRAVTVRPRSRRWMNAALIAASLVAAAGLGYFSASRRTIAPVVIAQSPAVDSSAVGDSLATVATVLGSPRTSHLTPVAPRTAAPVAPVAAAKPGNPAPADARVASNDSRPATPVRNVVNVMTADYDKEIARLRVIIGQRRNQLDPATVAVIERNLLVIDSAIVQCKRAISRDPASRFLIESLNQSLQTKVELMRTAALLPSRT